MDQDNHTIEPVKTASLGGKSWTAYLRVVFIGIVLLFVVTPFAWSASATYGTIMLVSTITFLVYQFLLLKSFHLYFDEVGVWVYSGILPWNKGVSGVKWRDLDEAIFFRSMGSWLFKSYSIRIGHRFTKSSEILLTHWAQGHEAVMAINSKHQELVKAAALS